MYVSGKRKTPPSVMIGPKAMSLTAPMFEMSSRADERGDHDRVHAGAYEGVVDAVLGRGIGV